MKLFPIVGAILPLSSPQSPPWREAFGLTESRGDLLGVGPDYEVRFTAEGFSFVPALGAGAEKLYPLSFSLESIRRGEAVILDAQPTATHRDEGAVRYFRGSGIVESYEVRRDGIEQAFLFEEPFPGEGDLVVRGRIETDLEASTAAETEEGIRFEAEGLGGVVYGAVTGIDARGSRAKGRLRFDGTHLELVLPGDFIAGAAYPLVLDPLVGASSTILGFDDADPDVAYDATNDLYLVVWERRFAALDSAIRGRRFSSDGSGVGNVLLVTPAGGFDVDPAVANVNETNRFLVAYSSGLLLGSPGLACVAVDASDGDVSGEVILGVLGRNPDVGGDPSLGPGLIPFQNALLAWEEPGGGIKATTVNVPLAGDPIPSGAVLDLSTSPDDHRPAVSKSCGPLGHWLVVWQRFFAGAPGDHDLRGRVVDRNGLSCTGATSLLTTIGPDEEDPDCAGDGTSFAIVWERESVSGSGDNDILCRTASFAGACPGGALTVGATTSVVAGTVGVNETNPAIDFAKFKYLVAWSREVPGTLDSDVYMAALAPNGCQLCEPATAVHAGATHDDGPEMAAQYSGATSAGDQVMIAWQSSNLTLPFECDVGLRRAEAIGAGGGIVDLGGGCGGGGVAGVNGPVAVGNSGFAFTLAGAAGPSSLVLSFNPPVNIVCGPCTLIPNFDFVFGGPPVPIPIPCDAIYLGVTADAQWLVIAPSACPSVPFASLSNAIRVTVGL
jgi:hypothetical protein